ncbi:hypothetical protein NC652_029064 [Populus alba x Populus x berolinensis]|nr:hypothetical protein NC652_029064 [Populus alba x Populus x berolinensis]
MVDDIMRTQAEKLQQGSELTRISGGATGLEAELQQLMDLRRVNQELLVQTEKLLQNEATEDAQFRSLKNRDALLCGGILFLFCSHQIESALPTLARSIMPLDANEDVIMGALK